MESPSATYRVSDLSGHRILVINGPLTISRQLPEGVEHMGTTMADGGAVVYLSVYKWRLVLRYWFYPADGSPAIEQVSY